MLSETTHFRAKMSRFYNEHQAIPKRSFRREIDSACANANVDVKWTRAAIDLLHQSTEEHIAEIFTNARGCAEHAGRCGLTVDDMKLAESLSR